MTVPWVGLLQRLNTVGRLLENALLLATLTGLILLAVAQILLRNVFDTGLVWSDELLRLMLLWLTMIGSVAASRENRHIKIDVLARFVPPRLTALSQLVTSLFATSICAIVAWHSLRFVLETRVFGDVVLISMPAWCVQAIIPAGFALVTYRYALLAASSVQGLRGGTPDA